MRKRHLRENLTRILSDAKCARSRGRSKYFQDVDELAGHTRPGLHAGEKALLKLLKKKERAA